ncbi:MAG TPA: Hsp20/alpha crystallin family protein [Rectinemataceae bacterium]|nr:Hsp20/alpha crystallin family protein [Rectinemataceae bacterium]
MDAKSEIEARRTVVPACSIMEDEGVVTVRLEMPGVAKDALQVKIEGNELAVGGPCRGVDVRGRYLLHERRHESYRKLFTLDDSIDREKVEAVMSDGVLTLKLHLKEAAKPRRIEVG